MMVLLVIVVVGAAAFVLNSLNASTMRADRYRVTQEALVRAKEALIAYAVSDSNRPGELPCPDVNDDGKLVLNEDYVGSACTSLVGRLPWIKLGLPDLRDGAGERLWYSLSNDFHANGTVALNSDTAYRTGNSSLSINGTQPASNVVAIVFSPGQALQRSNGVGQNRSCTGGTCDSTGKCTSAPASLTPKCNSANYLDISGTDNADGGGTFKTFVAGAESDTFNDRLIPILSDDIMSLVEKRAGRELAQKLRNHFDAWSSPPSVPNTTFTGFKGFYPWPAPFTDPASASPGVNSTPTGLLPFSASSIVWTSASSSLGVCTGLNTAQIVCTGIVSCPLLPCLLTINGSVSNVATALVNPPDASSVTIDTVLSIGTLTKAWTLNPATQTLDFALNSGSFLGVGLVTVTANAPAMSSSWLITNKWNQVSYYVLSQEYALPGTNSCVAGTTCITVSNTAAPNNDKQAVVITTGRALPAQAARPVATPAALSNFLEAGNQDPTDLVLERGLRTSLFNDQPTVVRP